MATGFRIFCNHRGERKAFCGMGGRYWFAKLPSAAVIEYPDFFSAVEAQNTLADKFERFAMIVDPAVYPSCPSGVELVNPKHVELFVD